MREYAKVFLKVDTRPELLKNHQLFLQQSLPMQQIIANGITKLAGKDAKKRSNTGSCTKLSNCLAMI